MDEDQDRRIRKTRRALAAALTGLTSERPYHLIQVRDITDRADVGYATFYRHYDSKDDLMLAVFDDITAELETTAGELASTDEPGEEYFEREGRLIFGHVEKYPGLYRSILQSREFAEKLKKLLAGRVEDHIQHHADGQGDLAFPLELAANHMVVALIGLIAWWLGQDMSLSAEKMAHIYERLVIRATWYALSSGNKLPPPWQS